MNIFKFLTKKICSQIKFCELFYVIISGMNELLKKVITYLEPDENNWEYWMHTQPLFEVSQATCMKIFKKRIEQAISNHEKVIVAGDYDCDGISATTIMVSGLRSLGLECGFYIPDRIQEGYGLNENTVRLAHKKGYSLIITVDNGVKAQTAIHLANTLGMDVIVSDHHTMDEDVDCLCVIHPNTLEDCFSTECGAAIAYECMRVLGVDTNYHLELAGLASISDMMYVTKQTRAIIQNALLSINNRHEKHVFSLATDRVLNEVSVAFQVVPKLNAIGRLSNLANVNNVVRYFLSEDEKELYSLSSQISQVNDMRKKMSDQMVKLALMKINKNEDIIICEDASFHEGIIGLVAGNICSSLNKPCIILARSEQGYKASMRSPEGFHCMEFLHSYSNFTAFGGHAQAAGFSLNVNDYQNFLAFVKNRMLEYKWEKAEKKTLVIQEDELSLATIQSLDTLRPFGPGFEFPNFELKNPNIKSIYDFQNHKHRKYTLTSGLQCMRFNQSEKEVDKSVNAIASFIGSVQINQYQGRKQANFVIDEIVYK